MEKYVVLHIIPHLSSGLGRVLHSTLKFAKSNKSSFDHEIVITDEKHLTPESVALFSEYSDNLHILNDKELIKKKMNNADIIQIEWWNHPLIYNFLTNVTFPLSRVILCSHVNGLSRPNIITESVINFSDIFIATTKATRKHPLFQKRENNQYHEKLRYITFPINFERLENFQLKPHEGFNIGYVGTLDYSKMHRNFLSMSSTVDVPKIKFIICDSSGDKGKVQLEAQKYATEKFQFMGFNENLKNIFEILDVFGYPLNANHYGSGEQVINEAMYAGLPVVAFSNPPEQEIISHNETGILVKDEQSYIEAIQTLFLNPSERIRIGMNARKHVVKRYDTLQCFEKLESIYKEVMVLNKRSRTFISRIGNNDVSRKNLGALLFIESLGKQGSEFFQSYMSGGKGTNDDINKKIMEIEIGMKMVTKGSLFQYLYFFPNDAFLNFWAGLISQVDDNVLKRQHISLPKTPTECFEKAARMNTDNIEFLSHLKRTKVK